LYLYHTGCIFNKHFSPARSLALAFLGSGIFAAGKLEFATLIEFLSATP
jgi:hypothetical protein